MIRRSDDELESPNAPNEVIDDKEYIDSLRASGEDPESQPSLGKSLRYYVRTYRSSVNVRVLRDTIEAKTTLKSRAELESLKNLITKHLPSGQFKGARIEILCNPSPELLEDLRKFCFAYKKENSIPFGIRLVYLGKAI